MSDAKVIADAIFDKEVLESETPVLVDFWAPWCGPCRMVAPTIDEIAGELGESLKVVKLDIDQNPITPGRYGVMSIPTFLVFKDGQVVDRWVGAKPKEAILGHIAPHLKATERPRMYAPLLEACF